MGSVLTCSVPVKIYDPPTPPSYTQLTVPELFWIPFESGQSKIPAVYYEYYKDKPYFTIIYSGCSNEDLGHFKSDLLIVRDLLKVNIFAFDYCGFGLHEYPPDKLTEKLFYDCFETAYEWLIKTKGIPPSQIIIMGKGLGTGPVVHLLGELLPKRKKVPSKKKEEEDPNMVAGLVLLSPMVSISSLLTTTNKDIFNNNKRISNIECPVLIGHGEKDVTVPIQQSKKLKKGVSNLWKFVELEGVGHYGVMTDDTFLESLIQFVKEITPNLINLSSSGDLAFSDKPDRFRSPSEFIKDWLKPLGLEEESQKFVFAGYTDSLSLLMLDQIALESIGITDLQTISVLLKDVSRRKLTMDLEHYLISLSDSNLNLEILGFCRMNAAYNSFYAELNGKQVFMRYYFPSSMPPETFSKHAAKYLKLTHPNVSKPTQVALEDDGMSLFFPCINNSLDQLIAKHFECITDEIKYKITVGVTSALSYLTGCDPPMHHGRLAMRHILINEEFSPLLCGYIQPYQEESDSLLIPFHWTHSGFPSPHPLLNLPPELLKTSLDLEKVDVYSFGVILCELTFGKFHTTSELFKKIQELQSFLPTKREPRSPDRKKKYQRRSRSVSKISSEINNPATLTELVVRPIQTAASQPDLLPTPESLVGETKTGQEDSTVEHPVAVTLIPSQSEASLSTSSTRKSSGNSKIERHQSKQELSRTSLLKPTKDSLELPSPRKSTRTLRKRFSKNDVKESQPKTYHIELSEVNNEQLFSPPQIQYQPSTPTDRNPLDGKKRKLVKNNSNNSGTPPDLIPKTEPNTVPSKPSVAQNGTESKGGGRKYKSVPKRSKTTHDTRALKLPKEDKDVKSEEEKEEQLQLPEKKLQAVSDKGEPLREEPFEREDIFTDRIMPIIATCLCEDPQDRPTFKSILNLLLSMKQDFNEAYLKSDIERLSSVLTPVGSPKNVVEGMEEMNGKGKGSTWSPAILRTMSLRNLVGTSPKRRLPREDDKELAKLLAKTVSPRKISKDRRSQDSPRDIIKKISSRKQSTRLFPRGNINTTEAEDSPALTSGRRVTGVGSSQPSINSPFKEKRKVL